MPMPKFSCFFVGEGSIALRCLEILFLSGHEIYGVCSSDNSLKNWSADHTVPYFLSLQKFADQIMKTQYDYLFSVRNSWIIPRAVISQARKATVNFHDSPLPKYAGLNATTWALINGETQHAITWHEVSPTIDAGEILIQKSVPIQLEDTSFSLNLRCLDAAEKTFQDLVQGLAKNTIESFPQDLSNRSYFGKKQRPLAACLLSFNACTQDICNLVRALDFGPARNTIGLPKLWLPGGVVAVRSAHPLPISSTYQGIPGQVLQVDETGISIATSDSAVLLSQLTTLSGQELTTETLVTNYSLSKGVILPELEPSLQKEISQRYENICSYESAWVRQLAQLVPFKHPYLPLESTVKYSDALAQRFPIDLKAEQATPLEFLCMIAAYCAKLSPDPEFDLGFQSDAQRGVAPEIFAEQVPLRVRTDPNQSFYDFQQQLMSAVEDICSKNTYALDLASRHSELRAIAPLPEMPVALVLADSPDKILADSLRATVAFLIYEDGSAPELVHAGQLDIWETSAIVHQLQTFMIGCIAYPQTPLMHLPLLTEEDRHQLLVEWNDTQTDYPIDQCIHELFEQQVKATPDSIAICYENKYLTYQELNSRSNQLAHYLRSLKIGSEFLVGICAERSIEMVIGIFGILKAGGAYVPIDPNYPTERINYILSDSKISILLTQDHLRPTLSYTQARIICLDLDWSSIDGQPKNNLVRNTSPENLVYVIYTSGSTGKPKGAMNTHKGLVNRILWMQDTYNLTATDRVLQKTPFSFDVSAWEFFWPLATGACLVVSRPEGHKDSNYLIELINKQKITTIHFVPSMLRIFLETEGVKSCNTLRMVFCSGEALTVTLQENFFERLNADLINLYGPTEAAIDVTYWNCKPNCKFSNVPIGRPVANTQIYILDNDFQPVPVGVSGELYIGGVQLARGYLNRSDLTAERFIDNPFKDTFNFPCLYKTGDSARYLPDGNIEYLGRLDNQVKIRGFRIELGEIEAVLAQHPSINEVVVIAREEALGGKYLVVYAVPHPDKFQLDKQDSLVKNLRQWVKDKLPEFMLPSAFFILESFPLTPNGKLDRRALPNSFQRNLETSFVTPHTPLQKMLAAMWEDILEVKVGIHDNFFELGGDSIRGAVFVNRLQQEIRSIIHISVIFEVPTVAELENYLNQEYPREVAKILGLTYREADIVQMSRVNPNRMIQLRQILPSLPPRQKLAKTKNRQAIFILSPPRSGSTLLRVILGGHPQLFAPPELFLLSFNNLSIRNNALSGSAAQSFFREGCVHAIKQLQSCSSEQAQKLMQEFEEKEVLTAEFFHWMQQLLDDRILVDKTPTYALDIETLKRIEEDFDSPLYIHLLRHPYGMIRSFEDAKLDQVLHFLFPMLKKDGDPLFGRNELAELVWLISHQNILEFLKNIPDNRQYCVRFEDLVSQPKTIVGDISQFLNLDFHAEMLQPYKEKNDRMTDGLHSTSRMLGDVKFHQHKSIDSAVADAWRKHYTVDFLSDITWQVAESLGYQNVFASSHELEEGEL